MRARESTGGSAPSALCSDHLPLAERDPETRSIVANRLPKGMASHPSHPGKQEMGIRLCPSLHEISAPPSAWLRAREHGGPRGHESSSVHHTVFQRCSERHPLASCCIAQGRLGGLRQEEGTSAAGQTHRSKHRKQRGSPRPAAAGQSPGTLSAWGSAVFCTWPASPLLASIRTGKGQEQT